MAHNFDSSRGYAKSLKRGGECHSRFWENLLAYLAHAGLDPAGCFFSNALMGLKPGGAVGPMPTVPGYADECRAFLGRQIEIVQPLLIVALGERASARVKQLRPVAPSVGLPHPSARELSPRTTRSAVIAGEGEVLRSAVRAAATRRAVPSPD